MLGMLKTMIWPFFVAGCLAQPSQHDEFRSRIQALQPSAVYGTLYRALSLMEVVWRQQDEGNIAEWDLSKCFHSQGQTVLLV
jgi:hypothetical protein